MAKFNESVSKTNNHNTLSNLRQPPVSMDAERSVLGGLILDNDSWQKIENIIGQHDFYDQRHQVIFKEIEQLVDQNIPFDVVTLTDALTQNQRIDQAGGLAYIADIVANTPTAENITAYANIVVERSKSRTLLNRAVEIANLVYHQGQRKSDELIDDAERKILAIGQDATRLEAKPEPVSEIMSSVVDRLDALMEVENGITGIPTGFADLDAQTSGLHPASLMIVAGRPSMGKTTFAMNIAENVARGADKPVLVFSLEMPAEDLVVRMISSLGKIDQTRMRNGHLNDEHWGKITQSMKVITQEMNMYIDDAAGLTPAEVRSRARRLYRSHEGLSLVVVDYLQLMSVPGYEHNRVQEVSEISKALKSLAKELHVPVMALSQLNRSVDDRADKRPMMSDLRESGAIEQDADLIMFVYRDEVYNKDKPENQGVGEIIIGKQRNGPVGNINVTFAGQFCKFADYTPEIQSPQS